MAIQVTGMPAFFLSFLAFDLANRQVSASHRRSDGVAPAKAEFGFVVEDIAGLAHAFVAESVTIVVFAG